MSPRFTLFSLFLWVALVALVLAVLVPMYRHSHRLKTHGDSVVSVAASSDGSTFGALMGDGTVLIWDREGTLKRSLRTQESFGAKLSMSFDGKLLAVSPGNFEEAPIRDDIQVLEVATREVWCSLPAPLLPAVFSPRDELLLAAGRLPPTASFPTYQAFAINDLRLPYGRLLPYMEQQQVYSFPGYEMYVIDRDSPPHKIADARFAAFSPDGRRLAVADESGQETQGIDRGIEIHDLSGKRPPRTLTPPAGAPPICTQLTWSPDGENLVAMRVTIREKNGHQDQAVEKYEVATGQVQIATLRDQRTDRQYSRDNDVLLYLPGGRVILVGAVGLGFEALDASTLEHLPTTALTGLRDVAAGIQGDTFIAAEPRSIDLYDMATLRPRRRLFEARPPNYWLPVCGLVIWLVVFALRPYRSKRNRANLAV